MSGLDGIQSIRLGNTEKIETMNGQSGSPKPILEFAERSYGVYDNGPSDAKVKTEMFKDEIMSKLNTSGTKRSKETIKYYLDKLVDVIQTLNGVKVNNLKPQGNAQQNNLYNLRLQELLHSMQDSAEFVGSGLSVIQDPKTGLYKLSIDNKFIDVPERKVDIVKVQTEDGTELLPEIID